MLPDLSHGDVPPSFQCFMLFCFPVLNRDRIAPPFSWETIAFLVWTESVFVWCGGDVIHIYICVNIYIYIYIFMARCNTNYARCYPKPSAVCLGPRRSPGPEMGTLQHAEPKNCVLHRACATPETIIQSSQTCLPEFTRIQEESSYPPPKPPPQMNKHQPCAAKQREGE